MKAYKDALAKARKLAQDNTSNTLSDHPTQKQIDDALEALKKAKQAITCLLYTSDAADDGESVDLGGRRIIKKKKKK